VNEVEIPHGIATASCLIKCLLGISQNLNETVKHVKEVAQQDAPIACNHLGIRLIFAIGVSLNRVKESKE
jgi:hypothetical protein